MEVGDVRVNPSAILSLISDLYGQVAALQQENEQLRAALAARHDTTSANS